jgi:endonuclease/exonuclease/phosphatase (EEP) superfamily protein YafD
VVAVLAWLTVTLWTRFSVPSTLAVLLQGLVPIVYLPAWVCGVVALAGRRWTLAAACSALVLMHLVLVVPALGSDRRPGWAASAPTVTVLAANLWNANPSPDAAAREVVGSTADVLILVEVSPDMRAALERAGIDELFPHQVIAEPSGRGDTDGIYSRLPPTRTRLYPVLGNRLPAVDVEVDGRSIEIVGAHIDSPRYGTQLWEQELAQLEPIARAASGPLVLAGDFNATRWHRPFRRLLDLGLTDAHEARGKGLSRSWPVGGTKLAALGPLMRIDHALVNDRAVVRRVRDVDIAGSDHRSLEVELALGSWRMGRSTHGSRR